MDEDDFVLLEDERADDFIAVGSPGQRGTDGDVGARGKQGEPGLPGVGARGRRGRAGTRGEPGAPGVGRQGTQGIPGVQGLPGTKGDKGDQGDKGEQGDVPAHEWERTRLRFRNPDDTWGAFTQLKGMDGAKGTPGSGGGRGNSANPGFDSISLVGSNLVFARPNAGPLGGDVVVDLSAIAGGGTGDESLTYFLGE